jgi:hypothetical protein
MSPPCHHFQAAELSEQVQQDVKGKRRKMEPGMSHIDLTACELLQMPQYKCDVEHPVTPQSRILCEEVTRFFRR